MDYWVVNSYGYPNPFGGKLAKDAWTMFLSFFDFTSFADLKNAWGQNEYGKNLSPSAVGSWKPTFEEFGLLYVRSHEDEIIITPGGHDFKSAGEEGNHDELAKIGTSLLLRYPLKGPPSPPRRG